LDPKIADFVSVSDVSTLVWLILVSATVLAIPASLLLVSRYRTVVAREISRAIAHEAAVVDRRVAERTDPPSLPLTIAVAGSGQSVRDSPDAERFFTQVRRRTHASAWVYAIAGAAFAAVMTYAWLVVTKDDVRVGTKILTLFWSYFWPTVLAFALVITTSSRARLAALGGYGVVWLAIGAWGLPRNPDLTLWQLMLYWLIVATPPTLMLAAVMFPRVRPVGPLILPMVALLLAGLVILAAFVWIGETGRRLVAESISLLPQDTLPVFWALVLSAAALPPLLGWRRFSGTAHRYQRRELSDEGLQIDSIFLFFAVVQSLSLIKSMPFGFLAGVFAMVAFRAVVATGMRAAKRPTSSSRPVNLLLLRVFALGRRSERLFSVLQRAWLRQGSIAMIAGPDLAASALEPQKAVQFMLGNLREQFVGNAAQLDDRFRSMDRFALPDGRYRINEFYCHANMWQRVMQRLVAESDVVLMDLRSFSPKNQGCVFELAQLIDIFDLRRILFVIDRTTDRAFLEEMLKDMWGRASATSPNRSLPAPTATLFHCEQSAERVLDPLLRQLFAFSQKSHAEADSYR